MCEIDPFDYDDNQVKVWDETWRTARKHHKCSSCLARIAPGERYMHHYSIADDVTSENACPACASDMSAFSKAHEGFMTTPRGFYDFLSECVDERDEESNRLWGPMLERLRLRYNANRRLWQARYAVSAVGLGISVGAGL